MNAYDVSGTYMKDNPSVSIQGQNIMQVLVGIQHTVFKYLRAIINYAQFLN